MRKLKIKELSSTNGGVTSGAATVAVVAGFVTAGPAGAGIALAGLVAAKGIDNLIDLHEDNSETTSNNGSNQP